MTRAVSTIAAAALCAAVLCQPPAPADDLQRGRAVYREHCLECHGEDGRGDGPKAQRLGFRPRNFSLGAFKCRSTPTGRPPTDDDLARTVVEGLPGTAMAGLGDRLAREEVAAVVAYAKSLAAGFDGPAPEAIAVPPAPEDLDALASEGQRVYQVLRCWTCHGAAGRGDGPAAKGLVDAWGDPIRVFNFAALKRFKCGGEPTDLYRTLHTGLTGSPMPSYTEAFRFGREQVAGATSGIDAAYDADQVAALDAWIAQQPEGEAMEAVSAAEVAALVEHRTWALVAYLRSLAER